MSYKLSEDETKRIDRNRDYIYGKRIYESHLNYDNTEIGEVFLVKRLAFKDLFITHYGKSPTKFYIIHKDDGFVFAKRISSNGNLGKEVICMTTSYPIGSGNYELVPDESYIESLILGTKYDPSIEGKSLSKRKNKARAYNKKLLTTQVDPFKSQEFIKSFKVGDKLWDTNTKFGSGAVEWTVIDIIKRKPCQEFAKARYTWEGVPRYKGLTEEDRSHNEYGFDEVIILIIESRKLDNAYRRTQPVENLTFNGFLHRDRWLNKKPKNPEDFI